MIEITLSSIHQEVRKRWEQNNLKISRSLIFYISLNFIKKIRADSAMLLFLTRFDTQKDCIIAAQNNQSSRAISACY